MKKIFLSIALLAGTISFSHAQQGPRNSEEMVKRNLELLDKRLALTEDQKTKITTIVLSHRKSMDSLRNAASAGTDRQAMRSKMQPLQKAHQEKIKQVLTDAQKKTYEAFLTEQQSRMGNGGQRRIRERPAN